MHNAWQNWIKLDMEKKLDDYITDCRKTSDKKNRHHQRALNFLQQLYSKTCLTGVFLMEASKDSIEIKIRSKTKLIKGKGKK